MIGVRYFDLQVALINEQAYITNMFACILLEHVFDQIYNFVTTYTTEFIILDISGEYSHTVTDGSTLHNIIFSHKLYELYYDFSLNYIPTYTHLMALCTPVILFIDKISIPTNKIILNKLPDSMTIKYKDYNINTSKQEVVHRFNLTIDRAFLSGSCKFYIFEESIPPNKHIVFTSWVYVGIFFIIIICICIAICVLILTDKITMGILFILIIVLIFIISIFVLYGKNIKMCNKDIAMYMRGTLVDVIKNKLCGSYVSVICGSHVDPIFTKSVILLNM